MGKREREREGGTVVVSHSKGTCNAKWGEREREGGREGKREMFHIQKGNMQCKVVEPKKEGVVLWKVGPLFTLEWSPHDTQIHTHNHNPLDKKEKKKECPCQYYKNMKYITTTNPTKGIYLLMPLPSFLLISHSSLKD